MSKTKRFRRVGVAGYVRVLAMLREKPCTIPQAVGFVGVARVSCYRILTTMHHLKLVHVSGWSTEYDRRTLPIYSYGPGEDAQPPLFRANGKPVQNAKLPTLRDFSSEVMSLRLLIEAMSFMPVSRAEMERITGLHYRTVRMALEAMVRHGLVHIDHWEPREVAGGPPTAHFIFGPGRSAPRPKPIPRAEINRRNNDRRRERLKFQPLVQAFHAPASNEALQQAA